MPTDTESFLRSLKSRNLAANVPSISESTARFLSDLVRRTGARRILELGTAHGYSTIWLAMAAQDIRTDGGAGNGMPLSEPEAHGIARRAETTSGPRPSVTTVDFSKPSYEAAVTNVREAGWSHAVTHVFADALSYLPTIADDRFDFVFLDAEKRSTSKLFDLAWPMIVPGGTMVVDDVVKFRDKMDDFYAMLESRGIPHEIVMTDPDDGVMVIRKPA